MSLLCLFTPKICARTIVRKSNLFSPPSCLFISSKFQSQRSKLDAESSLQIGVMDIDAKLVETAKSQLIKIFDAGVAAVLPHVLIENKVHLDGDQLVIDGESFEFGRSEDGCQSLGAYVVGFGKAVAGMASALQKILGSQLKQGIISIPRASKCIQVQSPQFESLRQRVDEHCQNLRALTRSTVIECCPAAENNQPDEDSLKNTEKIVELVQGLGESDTLIVLISGGGSALLSQPKAPVTAETKWNLCKRLQNAGASITELNCMRKQLSTVKGGGLAKIAYPAQIVSLILSDIVGDPIDFIASGPTCPIVCPYVDEETPVTPEQETPVTPEEETCLTPEQEAINVLQKYNLYKKLDSDVLNLLTEPPEPELDEKSMIDEEGNFKHVNNIIIGNNEVALQAASEFAKKFDLESIVLSNLVEGDVKNVSYAYAKLTRIICHILEKSFPTKEEFFDEVRSKNIGILKINEEKFEEVYEILVETRDDKGILLLAGGEPTVVVEGSGKGGRNQELALRFSLDWLAEIAKDPVMARYFALFLSAGTDGQDGPTDAAGAFGHPGFRPKLAAVQKQLLEKKKLTLIPDELQDIQEKLQYIEEMLPENILKDNNSYHFYSNFEDGQYLVKTGLTGTNVMDLHFIYLKKRICECDIQTFFGKNIQAEEDKSPKKFGDCPPPPDVVW